jgi:hypothetical protein
MLVFRSEAHVQRWLAGGAGGRLAAGRRGPGTTLGPSGGATIPITRLAELAEAWWWDRLDPAWQPHTRERNQAILDGLGLTGDFWRLG